MKISNVNFSIKIKRYITLTFPFLFFFSLSLIVTYPLIFNLLTSYYGGQYGDPTSTIWYYWWLKYSFTHGISSYYTQFISYPFGSQIGAIPFQPLTIFLVKPITILFNEVLAYNFMILLGFTLSGAAMYFLVYDFTRNRASAIVSGIIFAFSPYNMAQAMAHQDLANLEWMVFYALFLFRLDSNRTCRNAVLCGIFFSLVVLMSYYYAMFMVVFTLSFILYKLINKKYIISASDFNFNNFVRLIRSDLSKIPAVFMVTVSAILLLAHVNMIAQFLFPSGANIAPAVGRAHFNTLYDFIVFSAKPWMYLIPSSQHPLFGWIAEDFFFKHPWNGFQENSLYLGYVPLALALYGITNIKGINERFLVFSAVIAFIFSLGPFLPYMDLAGVPIPYLLLGLVIYAFYKKMKKTAIFLIFLTIFAASLPFWLYNIMPSLHTLSRFELLPMPLPSFLIYEFTPVFRVMSRFGVVVMLSVSVLAGIGLKNILDSISDRKKRYLVVSLVLLLISIEFINVPPFHTTDVSNTPEVYTWIASQPGDFTIVEYPLDLGEGQFYQRIHEKKMVNDRDTSIVTDKIFLSIRYLTNLDVPGMLKFLGVKYVIVRTDAYLQRNETIPAIKNDSGLELIKTFKDAFVYEVTAEPAETQYITYGDNFYPAMRWNDGRVWRWMNNDGAIAIPNYYNKSAAVNIHFSTVSLGGSRNLQTYLNGKYIGEQIIPDASRKDIILYEITLNPGKNLLELRSEQEPVMIDSIVHNGDKSIVSIAFAKMSVEYIE